jgi:hypothetical protein
VIYALKALEAKGQSTDGERVWQIERLPGEVRELVISGLQNRFRKRLGTFVMGELSYV